MFIWDSSFCASWGDETWNHHPLTLRESAFSGDTVLWRKWMGPHHSENVRTTEALCLWEAGGCHSLMRWHLRSDIKVSEDKNQQALRMEKGLGVWGSESRPVWANQRGYREMLREAEAGGAEMWGYMATWGRHTAWEDGKITGLKHHTRPHTRTRTHTHARTYACTLTPPCFVTSEAHGAEKNKQTSTKTDSSGNSISRSLWIPE